MPYSVGRAQSIAALEAAVAHEDKELLIVCQRDSGIETPGQEDLYGVGTKAIIKKAVRGEDARIQVIVQGMERVRINRIAGDGSYLEAEVSPYPLPQDNTPEVEALQREYVLRQQLRAIQEELAGGGDKGEVGSLRDQLAKAELPEDVRKEVERELNKLERIPPASPDYGVTRSYLEFVLELPWNKGSEH